MKINLDPWQIDFLNWPGDKILVKGRQVGASTVGSIDCGEYAVKNQKKMILITAPQGFQAEEFFIKVLNYLEENYKNRIKTGKDKPTKSEIRLINGTLIRCKTPGVTGLGLRSMTIHRLYVDECAQMPEMAWEAIDPELLTTGGATIYMSTPLS